MTAAAAIDPTKTPDEIVEDIEAAEEAKDLERIVAYLALVSSNGGDEDWAEPTEAALDAFYRLVKGGSAKDDPAESLLHLSAVLDCLNAWNEEEAIVEVGLGCLVALCSKADTTGDTEKVAIPVELVLNLMKNFQDESTIQEQACLAMEGLAMWSPSWKQDLATAEGIREELVAAKKERITNERNKAYPVRAAKALGIELE